MTLASLNPTIAPLINHFYIRVSIMVAIEANFDGLVGLSHNYAGLSTGNIASLKFSRLASEPKKAALQGLQKMKTLSDMGFIQGVLAPQERPSIDTLRALGFQGSDQSIIEKVAKQAPELLVQTCSASSMWAANACTTSPSADSQDGKVHFTPANLVNKFHRAIEHPTTGRLFKAIFTDDAHFVHHPALPNHPMFGDEGAANHSRLCSEYGTGGVEFFVYGQSIFSENETKPSRFPARQTLEASQAISRLHQLNENKVIFAQQNPLMIDAGVFHNDVIAVANQQVLFCYEDAFANHQQVIRQLEAALAPQPLYLIEVPANQVPIEDVVSSYLFNTQLLSKPDGSMVLIAPTECREITSVDHYLQNLTEQHPIIGEILYFDLKQSMQNGGGPACLRQRVVLTDNELAAVNQACLINDQTYSTLVDWVEKYYLDRLDFAQLADPLLLDHNRQALDELTQLLQLGSIYSFQMI